MELWDRHLNEMDAWTMMFLELKVYELDPVGILVSDK